MKLSIPWRETVTVWVRAGINGSYSPAEAIVRGDKVRLVTRHLPAGWYRLTDEFPAQGHTAFVPVRLLVRLGLRYRQEVNYRTPYSNVNVCAECRLEPLN